MPFYKIKPLPSPTSAYSVDNPSEIIFTEDDTIQGKLKKPEPANTALNQQDPAKAEFSLEDIAPGLTTGNLEDPDGYIQVLLAQLLGQFLEFGEKWEEGLQDYNNTYQIHYHGYNSPFPWPLQQYTVSNRIIKSSDGEYESCTLSLKIPYQYAMSVFGEEEGLTQPGGYILIKTRPPTDPGEENSTFGLKNISQSLFFGVVSKIDWSITVNQTTGNMEVSVDLLCNSFLHKLIYGEYRFSFLPTKDQTHNEIYDFKLEKGKFTENGQGSKLYFHGIDDFVALIDLLTNELKEDTDKTKNKFFRQTFEKLLYTLGYPILPVSLFAEPLDAHELFKLFMRFNSANLEIDRLISILKTKGLPAFMIKQILLGFANVLEIAAAESPIYGTDAVTSFKNPIVSNPEDSLKEARELREAASRADRIASMTNVEYSRMSIGSIIHVATTKDDLPPTHPLYASMPDFEGFFEDLTRIRNINSQSLTIWGLLKGTFQPDNHFIECYPTMIPINETDIDFFAKTRDKMGSNAGYLGYDSRLEFWQKIGGIPTIIYRIKPMHIFTGLHGIFTDAINSESEFVNKGPQSIKPRRPMQYNTSTYTFAGIESQAKHPGDVVAMNNFASQLLRDNQYGRPHPIYQFAGPSDGSSIKGGRENAYNKRGEQQKNALKQTLQPVQILKQQVISMSFSQSDAARINATFTNVPGNKNTSSRAKYGLMSDMYVNDNDAFRNGLRFYEHTWPFMNLDLYKSVGSKEKIQNLPPGTPDDRAFRKKAYASAISERAYMIYGEKQKYHEGIMLCSSLIGTNIAPGCWIEVLFFDATELDSKDLRSIRRRYYYAYITDVIHTLSTNQETGLVESTTQLQFERGSFGGISPDFPKFMSARLETSPKAPSRAAGNPSTQKDPFTEFLDEIDPNEGRPNRPQVDLGDGTYDLEPVLPGIFERYRERKDVDKRPHPEKTQGSSAAKIPAQSAGQPVQSEENPPADTLVPITEDWIRSVAETGALSTEDIQALKQSGKIYRDDFRALQDIIADFNDIEIDAENVIDEEAMDQRAEAQEDDYDFGDEGIETEGQRIERERNNNQRERFELDPDWESSF
jgi:hypothetical protein